MQNEQSAAAPTRGPQLGLVEAATKALTSTDEPARLLAGLAVLDPAGAVAWLASAAADERARVPATAMREAFAIALTRLSDGVPAPALADQVVAAAAAADCCPAAELARFFARIPPGHLTPTAIALAERVLDREPGQAGLLRILAERAVTRGEFERAVGLLQRLAAGDPSTATLRYVRSARSALGEDRAPAVRLALLSSYTIDPLIPFLDFECRELGLRPDIYLAPFNSWAREIIDPDSGLHRFAPEIVFLAVAIDDVIPALAGAPDQPLLEQAGNEAVRRVAEVAQRYGSETGRTIVVHTFHSAHAGPLGTMEGRLGPSRAEWLGAVNARLAGSLRECPACYVLDMTDLLLRARAGTDDPKLRHLASIRLPPDSLPAVARAYAGYIAPRKGLTRKCVVVDLDNTLWGGVVGEDGPAGIRLGSTAPGSEYVEFQRYLATLGARGILLAINSKNNPEDVLEVIRGHEAMILRESAFSSVRINWQPKPENMAAIAEELNIGLDALVFVDDNPDERELMRQLLPQVLTVELPRDPSRWRSVLERVPQLQVLTVTDEDRARVEQYAANRQREQVRVSAESLEQYLASLGIHAAIGPVTEAVVPRVAQLYQRTNQFNVTTRRYDAGDLRRFAEDAGRRLYVIRAGDRFGDHGLVATALVRCRTDCWTIDSFLMSCRVIGYGIETALLAQVSEDARGSGAARLEGEYIQTKKNAPARDMYLRHGFKHRATSDGIECWALDLAPGTIPFPHWIERSDHGT